jgi:hypothetical protein
MTKYLLVQGEAHSSLLQGFIETIGDLVERSLKKVEESEKDGEIAKWAKWAHEQKKHIEEKDYGANLKDFIQKKHIIFMQQKDENIQILQGRFSSAFLFLEYIEDPEEAHKLLLLYSQLIKDNLKISLDFTIRMYASYTIF